MSMVIPKWRMISKQNYIRLKDDPICDVKAVPIFEKGSGIVKQINGEAKIIGYEYYLQEGTELVFFVGSDQVEKFSKLFKQIE